jgi:predicted signal transduction protein with EAL and GGDEF domain
MRTFIRGTDKGNAVLTAIALIMILTTLFITFVPRIFSVRRYALQYKERVTNSIEEENRRLINLYDLH